MSCNVWANFTNGEATTLVAGELVRFLSDTGAGACGANDTVFRALASTGSTDNQNPRTIGVVIQPIAPGATGPVGILGVNPVLLENGTTLCPGDHVYLSATTTGRGAINPGTNPVVIGIAVEAQTGVNPNRQANVLVGVGSGQWSLDFTLAIGADASAGSQAARNIAIGPAAQITGTGDHDVVIGSGAIITNDSVNSVAIGTGASAIDDNAVAMGISALAGGDGGVAIGATAQAGIGCVAVGPGANSIAASVAVGSGATASGAASDAVAIGEGATVSDVRAVAIGLSANVDVGSTDGIAIGPSAGVTGGVASALAIGNAASAGGTQSIAIGAGASTGGSSTIAIGTGATASAGTDGIAIGNGATVGANGAIAIGAGANPGANSCQIGSTTTPVNQLNLVDATGSYFQPQNNPAANEVGLAVVINNGAVVFRQVLIGGANSGGCGFRLLRVAN